MVVISFLSPLRSVATPVSCLIASVLIVVVPAALEISPRAVNNSVPSFANFFTLLMSLSQLNSLTKTSSKPVLIDKDPISANAPIMSLMTVKDEVSIFFALSETATMSSMAVDRSEHISANPSEAVVPKLLTMLPNIVPIAPAIFPNTFMPISILSKRKGHSSIMAPTARSDAPRANRDPMPIIAAGPPNPIAVKAPRKPAIAPIDSAREPIFLNTSMPISNLSKRQGHSSNIAPTARIDAPRANRDPMPIIAAGPPFPITVKTPRRSVIAPIAATRDIILSFMSSTPSSICNIFTNT